MNSLFNKKIGFYLVIVFILFGGVYGYWQKKLPLVSPVSLIENNYFPSISKKKTVYGFLPYWNLKYSSSLQINYLTHLAYFGIDLNEDGTINKKNNSKELEPGWNKLNSSETKNLLFQSKLLKQKTILTVTAMSPDLIESIVNSPSNSNQATTSILEVYQQFNFDGINIDFEYLGQPENQTINNFTIFISKLKQECISISPHCFIDIDVFGDSSVKKRIWNLKELNPFVDHIVVMAYDYYRKTSTKAGPVAPLTGMCSSQNSDQTCLNEDILTHLSAYLKTVPSEKIVLGVPFYGYEWQTSTEDFLSNTYPRTGSLATYQRIQNLIQDPNTSSLSAKWSNQTLSPYLVYYDKDKIKQIHFEDQQSLKLKVDMIKAANLNGIAIWALGYEVPFYNLWDTLSKLNQNP